MKLIPAVAAICAIALPVSGQSTAKSVAAHRTSEQMTVDGHLTESAWSEAAPATGFIQREPDELAAATERTVFRVVYSENTIYIGVYCLDGSPAAFVSKEMERDAPLYRDDSVAVVLDTFADRRNAYTFETNVNGARFDALITDEGRNVLKEWDGVWNVAARRAPDGWVAEFAI
ncbi:MAG: carbohydrate binding family 9 domain-containing protein [Acidobacteriota bacterium]|nr:carbohydrate binding family 9 domain-containing protein [Acidobacteriota bacterium]